MLLAQELQIVRGEIDDQHRAAGTQHAGGLADGSRAVVEIVQHLMHEHDVEGIPREPQIVDIALPHAAMLEPGAFETSAREPEHVGGEVDAKSAVDLRPEQLEHAPGSGAEIQQRAQRAFGERGADGGFDRHVGYMQPADAVPLGGMRAEIGLRGRGARGAHFGQALAVPGHDRVGRIEPADEDPGDLGAAAALGETKECPGTLAIALDEPGFGEEPQMARDPRLRLAQDLGEVGDGELRLREQREHPQPGRFCGRPQRGMKLAEG